MKTDNYLQFVIERFDHYYDSANNKSSLYIALNTFILGGICVGYVSLRSNIDFVGWTLVCSCALLTFSFLSIYFTIRAMLPFLQHGKFDNDDTSVLYFGGIAKHALSDFKSRIAALDESKIQEELTHQTHCLAGGLEKKYAHLRKAGICILLEFFVLLPLLFLIFKNFKP